MSLGKNDRRARKSSSNKSPVHTLLAPLIGCIIFGCDPDITPPDAKTLPSFSIPDPNDITFVIVADPQFSAERTPANAEYHKEVSRNVARAINRIKTETWTWPTDGTSTVDAPLAVVMAGDLTQFAQFMEAETYRDVWGADKPGSTIDYPVYPGLGNHDYNRDRTAMVLYVKNRMRFHSHVTNMHDPDSTHRSIYSWDWGNVHFIQLNQFAGAGHADLSGLMGGGPANLRGGPLLRWYQNGQPGDHLPRHSREDRSQRT